jgi:hypothetical protein
LPGVFKPQGAALAWVRRRVEKGTVLPADEAPAWNDRTICMRALK